jgi:DNA-binding transcriptional ArsR family regulator
MKNTKKYQETVVMPAKRISKELKKFELASTELVDKFTEEVDIILTILGHPEALVTDLSSVRDFPITKTKLKKLSNLIGYVVEETHLIGELARDLYTINYYKQLRTK